MSLDLATLSRRDLRRFVKDLWSDPRCAAYGVRAVDAAVAQEAQSLDRAVLTGYLRHFPQDHPGFEHLRAAAQFTAMRRDWAWRERGERWCLWDANEAPVRLAQSMLGGEGAQALHEAGLEGDLAQGRLVRQSIVVACLAAANARGVDAQRFGTALIALFDDQAIVGEEAILAHALLAPWQDTTPDEDYRRKLGGLLVKRIGDPRIESMRWSALHDELLRKFGLDLTRSTTTLRRWLTEAAFKAFFRIIAATTDRPDQWEERQQFWLGYLDTGHVKEAWFAFGRQAEQAAAKLAQAENVQFGKIAGSGAKTTSSALIMSIGDLRIAEWSDDGATRFWDDKDLKAPLLYAETYFDATLRVMNGGRGFEKRFKYISHLTSWQRRFAGYVHRMTGIRHPQWGEGFHDGSLFS